MVKNIKAGLAMALAVSVPQFSACTPEQAAVAIGAGAIVGGAIVIGAHSECVGGYRNVCRSYRDYWGYIRHECFNQWDSCAYLRPRHHRYSVELTETAAGDFGTDDLEARVTALNWGEKFGISFEASERFIGAMKAAKEGGFQALTGIGLSKDDVERIARMELPEDKGIDSVALALGQDKAAVKAMFEQILQAVKEREEAAEFRRAIDGP